MSFTLMPEFTQEAKKTNTSPDTEGKDKKNSPAAKNSVSMADQQRYVEAAIRAERSQQNRRAGLPGFQKAM